MTTRSTIALAMLSHNEAHLLPRLFEQVGERINSAAIIVHPEYEDDTYEVAVALCEKYGIKHRVEKREPLPGGGGPARQEVWEIAREFDEDYVLWLDPDDPLVGAIPDELTDPIYSVEVMAKGTSWCAEHLVAREYTDVNWNNSVLHESLTTNGHAVTLLDDCHIDRSNGSGGGNERMREHDLPALLAAVERDPGDGHSWFYLAQTYRDLGMKNEALACYTQRAEMGGFGSLVYWCRFMVAELTLDVNDYLVAYNCRPKRVEALHRLAATYNAREQYHVARLFAYIGLRTPPTDDAGFVERWVEEYGLLAECAVAEYYSGEKQKAFEAFDYILGLDNVWPEHRVIFQMNLDNMKKEEKKANKPRHKGRITPKKKRVAA